MGWDNTRKCTFVILTHLQTMQTYIEKKFILGPAWYQQCLIKRLETHLMHAEALLHFQCKTSRGCKRCCCLWLLSPCELHPSRNYDNCFVMSVFFLLAKFRPKQNSKFKNEMKWFSRFSIIPSQVRIIILIMVKFSYWVLL